MGGRWMGIVAAIMISPAMMAQPGIFEAITVLTKLFGGQGTINVPSWSPDGRRLAFVSYQLVP
jgi:WD40-like Beta Propeller Repeat